MKLPWELEAKIFSALHIKGTFQTGFLFVFCLFGFLFFVCSDKFNLRFHSWPWMSTLYHCSAITTSIGILIFQACTTWPSSQWTRRFSVVLWGQRSRCSCGLEEHYWQQWNEYMREKKKTLLWERVQVLPGKIVIERRGKGRQKANLEVGQKQKQNKETKQGRSACFTLEESWRRIWDF